MIAHKKWLTSLTMLCYIVTATAQQSDIGVLYSASYDSKFAIEFRTPQFKKYQLKIGLTGNYYSAAYYSDAPIFEVQDSAVITRQGRIEYSFAGFRIGAERQLASSIFSIGADFNLNYFHRNKTLSNRVKILNDEGNWVSGNIINPDNPNFPDGISDNSIYGDRYEARINEHFLLPKVRVSVNANIPVGKHFLVTGYLAIATAPTIYVGNSNVRDPLNDFYTPESEFYVDFSAGFGLRYRIPQNNSRN